MKRKTLIYVISSAVVELVVGSYLTPVKSQTSLVTEEPENMESSEPNVWTCH